MFAGMLSQLVSTATCALPTLPAVVGAMAEHVWTGAAGMLGAAASHAGAPPFEAGQPPRNKRTELWRGSMKMAGAMIELDAVTISRCHAPTTALALLKNGNREAGIGNQAGSRHSRHPGTNNSNRLHLHFPTNS
jgi:hypothetical protein